MSFQVRKSHYAKKVGGKWIYKWNGRWNVVYQKDSGKSGKKQDALKKGSKEFLDNGFRLDMDFERAKEVAERLNSEEKIKREHEKQLRVQERVRKSDLIRSAYLPKKLVLEFESTIMVEKNLNASHWLKAISGFHRSDPLDFTYLTPAS
ncbi:MAG: hypothetical protein HYR96_04105 [Deltaproteobacteria bacterium]|nr:hypothetical protein [Deltaproteobacteria bacterium]MBI3295541.1 hypothetical protein [Deltaproteobacteria bacterium]